MKIVLPEKVTYIIDTLTQHGFEAYAVGGCVRDTMLGRIPMDWDITTSAKPEQVKELFRHTIDTGIQHGTVTVMLEHEGFEVTTYRIDGEYKDGLGDAFDGVGDLERGVIRCVGAAVERFTEDALRMLRAVRFGAQLGFSIEDETREAIVSLAPNIAKVSAERIQIEMVKLLTSGHPELLRTAYETGLTAVFLPEFDEMMKTPQNNPHHCYSVGEHTLHALMEIQPDKVARITMLLHDVAKPMCRTTDEHGVDHFYGHPQEGSLVARKILRRLKFDNDTTARVCRLILCHDDNPPLQERTVRRAIYRNGVDQYPLLFAVKRADMLAQSAYRREEKAEYLKEYEEIYEQIMAKRQCLSIKELAVTGTDLIADGMQPGKAIGETLKQLLEYVLEHPEDNTKEKLMEQVHNIASPHI